MPGRPSTLIKFTRNQLAALGQYFVTAAIIAGLLISRADAVPWWMCFPLATMLMLGTGSLAARAPRRARTQPPAQRRRRSDRR